MLTAPAVPATARPTADPALTWALAFVAILTGVRIVGLFVSPVELYPEEAQYWVWSRHLALGYFSKPPMIAWLIGATTAIGGSGEAWVRLSAPLVHGLTALALQRVGARLYTGWIGFWAAVLYSLMPGVQLSSAAIATDAPMLLFVSLALWGYAGLLTAARPVDAQRCAAGLGLALGLGALSKYAALYLVAGLAVHALVDRQARSRWRPRELALAGGLFLLTLGPNLAWNAAHGFETVAHTATDAEWGDGPRTLSRHAVKHFDPASALNFVGAQFAVFGPLPFATLLVCAVILLRERGRSDPPWRRADVLLLSLTAPPLLIVLAQALISRANANWAAAAYSPGSVLVAGWLVRSHGRWTRGARWTLGLGVGSQALVGAVFLACAVSPAFADWIGSANSFKRARGWREIATLVEAQARAARRTAPLSAIAVDDRFLFNALAYYGRGYLTPGAPPLTMWVREARAHNEAETSRPLTPEHGQRVLFVSVVKPYRREALADFTAAAPVGDWSIRLDPRHAREIFMFVGAAYRRQPRDPITGLPAIDSAPAISPVVSPRSQSR